MTVRGENLMVIAGRLGADPDLNPNAKVPLCGLSVAAPGRVKDGEQTVEWIKVTCFGKTATNVARFCKKGDIVMVRGKQQTDKWEDKEGQTRYSTKCVADRVSFFGAGSKPKQKDGENGFDDDGFNRHNLDQIPF